MLLAEGHLAADLLPAAEFIVQAERDGGYAARTQRAPRPEGTAAVLSALHLINGTAHVRRSARRDRRQPRRARAVPASNLVHHLGDECAAQRPTRADRDARQALASSPADFGSGAPLLWPQKAEDDLVAPKPSVPHTARAIRALVIALRSALADAALRAEAEEAIDEAAAWLAEQQNLEGTSKLIERPTEHGTEQLYFRHYTAAWVAKALLSAGLPAAHPAVSAALARIRADYQPETRLWRWSNGDVPVWMTLDSLEALRMAALSDTVTLRAP